MNTQGIDYDSVADVYDLYVTADYDIPFFVQKALNAKGPVLELTAGTGRLSIALETAVADGVRVHRKRSIRIHGASCGIPGARSLRQLRPRAVRSKSQSGDDLGAWQETASATSSA
ncbi:MAG: hypothetical protein AB1810_13605 [Pseudomonadota bacterium]